MQLFRNAVLLPDTRIAGIVSEPVDVIPALDATRQPPFSIDIAVSLDITDAASDKINVPYCTVILPYIVASMLSESRL